MSEPSALVLAVVDALAADPDALDQLAAAAVDATIAVRRGIKTGGRPAEVWFAVRDQSDQSDQSPAA